MHNAYAENKSPAIPMPFTANLLVIRIERFWGFSPIDGQKWRKYISDNGGYFSQRGCKQRRRKILLTVLKLARLIPFKRLIQDEIFRVSPYFGIGR